MCSIPLLLKRGKPECSSLDNGPEFSAAPLQAWLRRVGIQPIRIYPRSPWENDYNERFNGTLRHEVLNAEWFATTLSACVPRCLKRYLRNRKSVAQLQGASPHSNFNEQNPTYELALKQLSLNDRYRKHKRRIDRQS